jgi:Glycosyl transferase family 2
MKPVKTGFPPGTLGIPSGLQPRFWEFINSLDEIEVPEGTIVSRESSCDITYNCNSIIGEMEGDWIWFIDDDQVFQPDLLMKLLNHAYGGNGIDIVMPLNVLKSGTNAPMVFHSIEQLGRPYRWEEVSGPGLFALPVGDMVGRAGMLIKRHVLDSLGFPWIECGQLCPGIGQEDTYFALKVQRRGYKIWIDRDIVLDHIGYFAVRARRDQTGRYRTEIVSTGYAYDQGATSAELIGLKRNSKDAVA